MTARSCYRVFRSCCLLGVSLFLAAAGLRFDLARAQTPEVALKSAQALIAHQLELIQIAEQEHRSEVERGTMWARLAMQYHANADFLKAEHAYIQALHLLKNVPSAKADYAGILGDLAALYLNYGRIDEAESVRKQELAVRATLGDATDIGVSEVNLANVAVARHDFKKAERLAALGMVEMNASRTPPRVEMLSGLITISYARCLRGKCREGLVSAQQALAFAESHFEAGSAAVGFAQQTLGFVEWKNGAMQDGEKDMVHAIKTLRTSLAPADPRLSGALRQYADYLSAAHRRVEAQEISQEADRMTSEQGRSCATCTVSVYGLSNALR